MLTWLHCCRGTWLHSCKVAREDRKYRRSSEIASARQSVRQSSGQSVRQRDEMRCDCGWSCDTGGGQIAANGAAEDAVAVGKDDGVGASHSAMEGIGRATS